MKRIISAVLIASFALAGMVFPTYAEDKPAVEIYVSPDGKDTNHGTKEQPLKTFEGAVKLARQLKTENENTPINVIFREGKYIISKTVKMTSVDSGTENAPITYMAMKGETPVFTSAIELDKNDFSAISDKDMYKRFPKESRDKIGELNLKKYGITTVPKFPTGKMGATGATYYQLYLNDNRQTLARWPNEGYDKLSAVVDSNNKIFKPGGSDITGWGSAKAEEIHIGGFFSSQYGFDRTMLKAIDTKEGTLQMTTTNVTINGANRRYFLENFAEELDIPNEWYINPETMMLYYYPEHSLSDETLELAIMTTDMFNLNGVQYVNFEGLTFEKHCHNVFNYKDCHYMNYRNLRFDNVRTAINDSESTNVKYNYDISVPSGDITIENSVFTNIYAGGVGVTGGEYYTLTPGNVIVRNNYFKDYAQDWKNYAPAIDIAGVGLEVINNTICDAPGNAIQTGGNDHKVMYNEIYEVCKDVHDAGAIYEGRNKERRGTEISYNYIHDITVTDPTIGEIVSAVYMDDNQSEWDIHHNIFKNVRRAVFCGGGDYTEVNNNIFIDCPIGPSVGVYPVRANLVEAALEFYKKYPAYKKYHMDDMEHAYEIGCNFGNVLKDNLLVNSNLEISGNTEIKENYEENNISYATADEVGFKDANKQNYEIQPNSEVAEKIPGLLEIDMSKMGASKDIIDRVERNELVKFYPQNGEENVQSGKLTFMWEENDLHDQYIFRLATDSAMENIVYEETIRYNSITLENILESGKKTYYWDVTGISTSKENHESVKSLGSPYKFKTAAYDELNKVFLDKEIERAEAILAEVSPGEEIGQASQSDIDAYRVVYDEAKKIQKIKYSTQKNVNQMVETLQNATIKFNTQRNIGYDNLADEIENATWRMAGENKSKIENGVITLLDQYIFMDEIIPAYKLSTFQMKPDKDYKMIAITLRLPTQGIIWAGGAGSDGYTIIIKPALVEYQRYKNGSGGILKTVDNIYLKAGEWNDIEVGAVPYKNGIKTILRINGNDVLNEYDDSGIITKEGNLQFENFNYGSGLALEIKGAESMPEFTKSIVTGQLDAVGPEEITDLSAVKKTTKNGVTSITGLKGNEILNLPMTFNGQEIALRADDKSEYRLKVSEENIILTRKTENGSSIMAKIANSYIKLGEKTPCMLGAYPTDQGMRILFYVNGQKVIDYVDVYSKNKSADIKIYENNKGSIF